MGIHRIVECRGNQPPRREHRFDGRRTILPDRPMTMSPCFCCAVANSQGHVKWATTMPA
ncbi:hypothetical protein FBY35_0336 [Streptomyces sp. SLBN-118]|nr:hypothetical protein FBY35_0336 [Streptomyces sp. SLBN-118]